MHPEYQNWIVSHGDRAGARLVSSAGAGQFHPHSTPAGRGCSTPSYKMRQSSWQILKKKELSHTEWVLSLRLKLSLPEETASECSETRSMYIHFHRYVHCTSLSVTPSDLLQLVPLVLQLHGSHMLSLERQEKPTITSSSLPMWMAPDHENDSSKEVAETQCSRRYGHFKVRKYLITGPWRRL